MSSRRFRSYLNFLLARGGRLAARRGLGVDTKLGPGSAPSPDGSPVAAAGCVP